MIRVSGVSGLLGELLLLLGQAGHWMKVGCVKPSGVSGRGAKDFLIAPSSTLPLNASFPFSFFPLSLSIPSSTPLLVLFFPSLPL